MLDGSASLSSSTQSQTPSRPSHENLSWEDLIDGYVIDNPICAAWGVRIINEPLDPEIENDPLERKFEKKTVEMDWGGRVWSWSKEVSCK